MVINSHIYYNLPPLFKTNSLKVGYYGTNEVPQNENISVLYCQGWSPDVISIIRIFLRLKLWEE